ncbi:MAG: N-acetylmuramic acid 6-phosphate etherase [Verrucomicrobiales bacterium]
MPKIANKSGEDSRNRPEQALLHLGIEAGGTKTIVLAANASLDLTQRWQHGPANLRLISDKDLTELLLKIAAEVSNPATIGIGMAGLRDATDRIRVEKILAQVWPGIPAWIGNDLEIALAATGETNKTQVLILSGTGSCCYGRARSGATAKLGGWGHLIGDKGSGYEIGLRALKAIVFYYDRDEIWSELGTAVLRRLALNSPNDLISWVQQAGKAEIAALTLDVFEAASKKDKIALDILEGAAHSLSKDGVSCAKRLAKPGEEVEFILAGSVLLKQPEFAKEVCGLLNERWPAAQVQPLEREAVWGALLAAKAMQDNWPKASAKNSKPKAASAIYLPPPSKELSPTEQRNQNSRELDKLSISAAVKLMLGEEGKVVPALLEEERKISKAVSIISHALQSGGRLFYVGAGTSGRLGVLDASECPPTFRTSPEMVQGIIAGGQKALWQAVEGAEDDAEAGAEAIRFRGATRKDVVVGIAASGRTPFVWGAFHQARKAGAATILVCFNPYLKFPKEQQPSVVIAPKIGPEVLTGSSRLKSGTATKLILNMFTTLAMVQMGKVMSNLMVDLNPSNMKLRDRAARIVMEVTGCDRELAEASLHKSNWVVKAACEAASKRSKTKVPISRGR